MANDLHALLASIQKLAGATKLAVEDGHNRAVGQTEVLMDELSDELQRQILALGNPNGGNFTIATTEAKSPVTGSQIDVGLANHYTKTVTANTTMTLTNVPTDGRVATFIFHVTNGGAFNFLWWPNVKWSEGGAPKLTAAGRDVIGFSTFDGGATWDGYVIGRDMKAAA